MIKMTRGYYGYRNGKIVDLKDVNSPAFDVDEKEAKRLIGLGVAKAVDEDKTDVTKADNDEDDSIKTDESTDSDSVITGHLTEEQLNELSYPELKKLCNEMGVSAIGKKNELIERLVKVEVNVDEQAQIEESDFPDLQPAEPEA